jgi:hypothetical protein
VVDVPEAIINGFTPPTAFETLDKVIDVFATAVPVTVIVVVVLFNAIVIFIKTPLSKGT